MWILKLPKLIWVAFIGLGLAIYYMNTHSFSQPPQQPVRPPAQKPYEQSLAGVGLIESYAENIEIAPYFSGRVASVAVVAGDRVKAGDVLFTLDQAALNAQQITQLQGIASLTATVNRLKQLPRPESIPPLQAAVAAEEARVANLTQKLNRFHQLRDPRAVSQEEVTQLTLQLKEAQALLSKAKAELDLLQAGTWAPELEEAKRQLATEQTRLKEIQVLLDQSVIRATVDGVVLQVNVRPGEYISLQGQGKGTPQPAVLLGRVDTLQVRVDIDEVNASFVTQQMAASAFIKGQSKLSFPLRFVRIEPYMVPKTNLTGDTAERNDVRVLQVIYDFQPPDFPVYVGQQVEVFLNKQNTTQNTQETTTHREPADS